VSVKAQSRSAPYAELARGLLYERVLDAVGELLRDRPWAQVTMGEAAARAGVSRQTLYNVFGSRHELMRIYVGREADRFLAAVDLAVGEHPGRAREALAAALEGFLTAAGEHPLARAIISADGSEELLRLLTTRGGPVVERGTEHLTGLLIETWPRLERSDAAPLADALARLAISHAILPGAPPAETARTLAGIFGPRLDELLG
jgi:AcrR family transcriptional regulator